MSEDKDTATLSLRELHLICLAARRTIHHDTDMANKARDVWLGQEFENYVGVTREELLEILTGLDPELDAYQERQFEKMLRHRKEKDDAW